MPAVEGQGLCISSFDDDLHALRTRVTPQRRPEQSLADALTLASWQNVEAREQQDVSILLYREGVADDFAVLGRYQE